jgi:hypothetical protein
MFRKLLATLCAVAFMALPASAAIPDSLQLSGTGSVRYLGFIKVYDASLYAPPKTDVSRLLGPDCSRCLSLDYSVEVTVENFVEAAETVLARQHQPSRIASIREQLDLLHANYRTVTKDDNYTLCYDASSRAASLYLNGSRLVQIPEAAEFSELYFGIWLDEIEPLDKGLRTKLLAGLAAGRK